MVPGPDFLRLLINSNSFDAFFFKFYFDLLFFYPILSSLDPPSKDSKLEFYVNV